MPINASYEFGNAEKQYLEASTLDEKIEGLREMIKTAPKHKGSENLIKELKTRLKKFLEKKEKAKSSGKSSQKTIRKEGFQCALIGLPNTGKSSLLAKLTNAKPRIDSYEFTTKFPEIGTLDYEGIRSQMIDLPSIGSENFDASITNTADCLLITITDLPDIPKIEPYLKKTYGTKIFLFTKSDLLNENGLRKLNAKIRSKRLNALAISSKTNLGVTDLKEKIFQTMKVIRVYTKEPGKPPSKLPIVLPLGSKVRHAAESILKGFSLKVKETRLTGPSSKFSNQKVGLKHILKDKDVIEFHTKD